jgi:hypothetical protein
MIIIIEEILTINKGCESFLCVKNNNNLRYAIANTDSAISGNKHHPRFIYDGEKNKLILIYNLLSGVLD